MEFIEWLFFPLCILQEIKGISPFLVCLSSVFHSIFAFLMPSYKFMLLFGCKQRHYAKSSKDPNEILQLTRTFPH